MKKILECKLAELGLKPATFAKMIGLPSSTIDDILKGKTNEMNIGVSKVLAIANGLGMTVEELYQKQSEEKHEDPAALHILQLFGELNEEGKEKALAYLEDLVDTGKYKKHNKTRMVSEA